MKIVQNLKRVLTKMGDINQRQTICLTPCTKEGLLLQRKPESWDEIKDGMFLIINIQHSVTTFKQLQLTEVRDAKKIELQTWKTYIIWSLKEPACLHIRVVQRLQSFEALSVDLEVQHFERVQHLVELWETNLN